MLGGRSLHSTRKTAILLTLHPAIQTWLRLSVLELHLRGLPPGRDHTRLDAKALGAEPLGAVRICCPQRLESGKGD